MTSVFFFLFNTTFAASFTFAALGDAPYYDHEEQTFVEMLAAIDREPLAFSVHVGDFKSGHSDCSNALYQQRREWFGRSAHPFVFVPGDNDWTDCWRTFAGGAMIISGIGLIVLRKSRRGSRDIVVAP